MLSSQLSQYQLKISEQQAEIISAALELYARLLCGQAWPIAELFIGKPNYLDLRQIMENLSLIPELPPGSSHSICAPITPEKSKIAYDLHQVIRHRLAWDKNPKGGMEVWYDDPMNTAGKPLAEIKACD